MQRNRSQFKQLFLAVATLAALSGCSAYVKNIQNTVEYAIFGADSVNLSDSQIKQLQYATQYISISGQPRAAIVLGYVDADQHTYVSADSEAVVLRHGRMVATEGLNSRFDNIERPIKSVHDQSPDPLVCLTSANQNTINPKAINPNAAQTPDCPQHWQATIYVGEGMDEQRYQLSSQFSRGQQATLSLPGGRHIQAQQWLEQLTANQAGEQWQYQNEYWLSTEPGQPVRVVQSVQQLVPDFPQATWQELKPYFAPAATPATPAGAKP
ncbi:MAG: hypothetical protein CMF12_06770 [Idiomarina sp.]|uniref:YjbF family lipoprotein n=1 Tax=Idiomarina sp. TaxID=1874361 RepID=UPI000C5CD1A3|nr:YjbF family lipoprotein [Idiomarina sp.]MBT42212.1 hypothetical protein [Idiomarina sp.]